MSESVIEKGSISVQMENIFPLIKKWLYSDKDIFVRELVTNGLDAISKLKQISAAGEFSGLSQGEEYRIDVKIDREKNLLVFSDNGIGMTGEEIKKYINEVAFSGAADFMNKYKGGEEQNQIIGHFGLGFYSAFMVATLVQIDTLSYREGALPVLWSCDGSPEFVIAESARKSQGTDVILHISEDEKEFLDEYRVHHILEKYCNFMPVPIYLNGIRINEKKPLWMENPQDLKESDYIDFYKYLYPFAEDPIFWIHINVEFPVRARGILYFPKLQNEYDPAKNKIRFYYNQVYVSDNLKDLIPDFLINLRGVIDCPDMPLNVSRSYLQQDSSMKKLSAYITRKVSDELMTLFRDQRTRYEKDWDDLSPFIKIGMMEDDKFYEAMKEALIFKTPSSDFVTFQECLDADDKKIYYASDPAGQAAYIAMFREQGLRVLLLDSWLDTHFVQFLEMKNPQLRFLRVDAEVLDAVKDDSAAAQIVDPKTNKTFAETMEDFFKSSLEVPEISVKVEYLKSASVPAMVVLKENQRRMQELTAMMQRRPASGLKEHTLVVNANSSVVKNLRKMMDRLEPPLHDMKLLVRQIYDQALFGQKSFSQDDTEGYLERSREFLEAASEAMLRP